MAKLLGGGGGQWDAGDLKIHSGTLEDIPFGWELAEEMVDRAVVGAGGTYSKGQRFGGDFVTPDSPNISINSRTLAKSQLPVLNVEYGVTGGTSSPARLYRCATLHGTVNLGGSGASHDHPVTVGKMNSIDTRQQSIAVIWIRKL